MLFEYVGAYFALNVQLSSIKCDSLSRERVRNKNVNRQSNFLTMIAEGNNINPSSRLVSTGVRNICDVNTLKNKFTNLSEGKQRSRSRAVQIYCSPPGTSSDAITVAESEKEVVPLRSGSDSNSSNSKDEEESQHLHVHSKVVSPNSIIGEQSVAWSTPSVPDVPKMTEVVNAVKAAQPLKIVTKTEVVDTKPPSKVKSNPFKTFLKGNWLVIGEVLVIMLARLNPAFGATGGRLRPEFFVSKLGVFTIFFINGIALSIGELMRICLWCFAGGF